MKTTKKRKVPGYVTEDVAFTCDLSKPAALEEIGCEFREEDW